MSNERFIPENVGVYEVLMIRELLGRTNIKYHIITKEPRMPKAEFDKLMDKLMINCSYDIDHAVRTLVSDHGFKYLGLESKLTYDPAK